MAGMTVTTGNVIAGACTSFSVDGNPTGGTEGGVDIEKKQTFVDLSIDQITGVARKQLKEETYTVTTSLAEATLQNLYVAWNNPTAPVVSTSPANTTLNVGLSPGAPTEHVLVFVGPCPTGTYSSRTFTLHRAIGMSTGKISYTKDKQTVFPVTFECLPELTNVGNEYGTVVDQ